MISRKKTRIAKGHEFAEVGPVRKRRGQFKHCLVITISGREGKHKELYRSECGADCEVFNMHLLEACVEKNGKNRE